MSPEGGESKASSGYLYLLEAFAFQGNEFADTQDFKRKLTAILSADVAGYSRLMGEDEAATVRTLETYRKVIWI